MEEEEEEGIKKTIKEAATVATNREYKGNNNILK